MGFVVCRMESLDGARLRVRRLRPLTVGGRSGLLARNVGALLTSDDGRWSLSAETLLRLAEPNADTSMTILFDLTPKPSDQLNLYELVDVTGQTSTDWTDAVFHFKIACSRQKRSEVENAAGELTLAAWRGSGLDRYEQLRLEGGSAGGRWSWSEPAQALSAVLVRKP